MENCSKDFPTSILQLPDDCLYSLFHCLNSASDRESFGLTCHRWLHVQNSSRRSLQFECSLTHLSISSLSQNTTKINSFHLHRLLNRFQQLQGLSLSGCTELPDSGLAPLQYYGSKLLSLLLDCCFGITDSGVSIVASGCPSLTILSLYRCNISDVSLQTLSKSCLVLKDINLSYCSLVSDHGIRALSQNCCQLRAIRISYCKSVTGIGFWGCSDTCSYLEADSCNLEPEGIRAIVSGGGLEYLNISGPSWSLLGDGLTAIGAGFASKLRILNCRACRTICDDSITSIAKGCRVLQEWNLALCHEIRAAGWESIAANCSNLEKLHVNRCQNLSDQGLEALRSGCRKLSVLYITGCRGTSSTAIEIFKCLRGEVDIIEEEIMCIAPEWAFRL